MDTTILQIVVLLCLSVFFFTPTSSILWLNEKPVIIVSLALLTACFFTDMSLFVLVAVCYILILLKHDLLKITFKDKSLLERYEDPIEIKETVIPITKMHVKHPESDASSDCSKECQDDDDSKSSLSDDSTSYYDSDSDTTENDCEPFLPVKPNYVGDPQPAKKVPPGTKYTPAISPARSLNNFVGKFSTMKSQ